MRRIDNNILYGRSNQVSCESAGILIANMLTFRSFIADTLSAEETTGRFASI